ncbi:trihelix transcription factor ASIL1-like [Rhopalosiphum maidis]|uniref:trihelix transcription factor ASIL1-like n=1 Tax=Rhopalosiphum maidis TaxID=43146 RepID=UPI000F00BEA5|nr:trihelix transcription factor ASIL1-like [Rhopalosiphum maidis]
MSNVSNDKLLSTTTDEIETTNELTGAFKWPNEAILLLIEEYQKRSDDFCSGKVSQKKTWQAISDSLSKKEYFVSGPQCLSKFSDLKRTYKSIKDHINKSGNGPRIWVYFNIMDSVNGTKPYIKPIATASSTGVRNYSSNDESV